MRTMFRAMFSFFTSLFQALEMGASAINRSMTALDAGASWAEDEAVAFRDEARVERADRMERLREQLAQLPEPGNTIEGETA